MVEPDELESLSAGTEAACSLMSNVQVNRGVTAARSSSPIAASERRDTREKGVERVGEDRAIMARARESLRCSFGSLDGTRGAAASTTFLIAALRSARCTRGR